MYRSTKGEQKYISFLSWIEENSLFLYFTGQSFQETSRPSPYKVDLDAKYLCKNICIGKMNSMRVSHIEEDILLKKFRELDINTKLLLSSFSFKLYRKAPEVWKAWINYPIWKQIGIASAGGMIYD